MAGNEVRKKLLLQSVLDVLIQGILLALLFISPWFYGLTRFQDQLIAQVFVFSIFLLTFPFLRRSYPSASSRPLDGWVLFGLGLAFLYVLFSVLAYPSLLAFLKFLSCVIVYGWVRRVVRTEGTLQVFLWSILVLGLFYSAYGLLQYYGFLPNPFWYQPESLASRYVNGGHFGVFLLFPVFVGLSLLGSSRHFLVQLLLILFLLVIGWALLLTRSRAVWLAFLAGLVLFILLVAQKQALNQKTILGILLFLGIGGFLFWSRGGLVEIGRRFEVLEEMGFYSLFQRWHFWEAAAGAIQERPWGWGLGTLSLVLPQHRVHADRFFIDYAHNEFLQVGVDLGIPGILFLAGFLVFYLRGSLFYLKRRSPSSSQKVIAAGFFALWASLVLVCQVDFPLRIYATGVLFATFLGLSAYRFEPSKRFSKVSIPPPTERPPPSFFRKASRMIPWLLVLVLNFITARQLFADFYFSTGQKLEGDFSWKEAQREYEKAVRFSPFFARYYEALGSLYERRGKVTLDAGERKDFLKKALWAYQEATRLNPYQARTHYILALRYEEEGEVLHAQAEFLKAISREPTNALFLSEYGYFALRHSLVEEALDAFERVSGLPFHGEAKTSLDEILTVFYRVTQDYDQLRRVTPDHLGGLSTLARFLGGKGRWDLARRAFEELEKKGKEKYHEYPSYFESIGRYSADFYLSHHRFKEALEIYQEAATMLPQNEEVQRKMRELNERPAEF